MLSRAQSKPVLADLLDLWHGDAFSAGWASPTLAMNIARITCPTSARNLTEQIYVRYKTEDGKIPIPEFDKDLIRILNAGYKLYREL